jgi:hypothetical protein
MPMDEPIDFRVERALRQWDRSEAQAKELARKTEAALRAAGHTDVEVWPVPRARRNKYREVVWNFVVTGLPPEFLVAPAKPKRRRKAAS